MDWFLLGIEPTKDKKAITNAYRQKLRQTNPEDKPEEFKALRSAYEEALAFADQADAESIRDESPVGLWMEAIEKLYDDYASRIDPTCWKEVVGSDVCIGLDTRPVAEEALLKFLLENYQLPKAVWQVLDDTFSFSQRTEELYETWPREFIDHAILGGLRYGPALDPELFIPGKNGKDCDNYSRLYFQANRTPLKQIGSILEQMEALSERHPYGEGLRYHFYIETGREAEGKEGLRKLAATYPNNPLIATSWASLCLEDGNVTEAQAAVSNIMELEPQNMNAKAIYAKCLAAQQQYHEAKEIAYDIMQASGDNPMLLEHMNQLLKQWNLELIRQREAAHAENPKDSDNAIELAFCYAQNDRLEDSMALAKTIDPNCEDAFGYHNLMSKLYLNTDHYDEALPYLQKLEQILQTMTDDGTDKTRKRMARLPEMLQLQGHCLSQLGRTEEAKEKYQQALAQAPGDPQVLSMMGKILFASGDYAAAIELFQQQLRQSPDAWVAEMLMAMAQYRLRRDRDAFESVNRALAMQEHDLSIYLLKAQILLRNEIFEEVHEILDLLKQVGAPKDLSIDLIHAQLADLEKKDGKSAMKQYRAIQKKLDADKDFLWAPELYYRLAVLTGNSLDLRNTQNRDTVLQLVDKGLDAYSQDPDLLAYKAWVLKKGDLPEDAIAMYKALLEKNAESEIALRGLADIYYEDLDRNADKALTYYEKLLEKQKTAELYFYAATCKRHLGDLEGARIYYLKELEMDAEDIDGFRGLALICDSQGKYAQSLELLEQALSIMEEYQRSYDWMVEHKAKVLRRLGRFEEAFAFAAEAVKRYQFGGQWQMQFEICCQAGWWDRAKQVLDQWKLANPNDADRLAASGRLHLLQGKLFKAAFAMGTAKHKLPFRQVQDFRLQLAEMECNYARQAMLLSQRIQMDPKDDHALSLLALAYWHMGKQDAARGAAHKALAMLDDTLSQHLTDEPLYRSRRSLMLAVLGRVKEAKAELARTKELPLCHFCEYGSCKDADIYEAQIEEILGNTEQAQLLYTEGKAKWPDDLDFLSGQQRLKKKGRK